MICIFILVEISTSPSGNIEEADFEKAIEQSGHGKFNYLLLLVAIPAAWSSVFETSNTSFLLPAAECDLNLSHFDKGLLNAVVYIGKQTILTFLHYTASNCF